jgi:hypothetical protein
LDSAKFLEEPSLAGGVFKVMNAPGYDAGGVTELSLWIDLEDTSQHCRHGDTHYFTQPNVDQLPCATHGPNESSQIKG